jgi:hypothetical protein
MSLLLYKLGLKYYQQHICQQSYYILRIMFDELKYIKQISEKSHVKDIFILEDHDKNGLVVLYGNDLI